MKKITKNWLFFISSEYWEYSNLFFIFIGLSCMIAAHDAWQVFPTFSVAFLALMFSFFAYKHSKEKFRLDLYERRYAIYENVVKFCSSVTQNATLKKVDGESDEIAQSKINGRIAAHEAFRGLGYHKSEMLFGPDIQELMAKLNKSFAVLTSKGYPPSHPEYQKWSEREEAALDIVLNTIEQLPKIFKSYMYFGNYRNTDIKG